MTAQMRLGDMVDDLEGAEDLAGALAHALRQMLDSACGFDATTAAIDALAEFSGYCRPSCGYLDDGVCHTEDPDVCGCICGHADKEDPLERTDLRPQRDHPPAFTAVTEQ